jgi:Asp/Glu/hydantoin racemase
MTALRIWHQSTTEIDHIGVYKTSLIERARKILGGEAEIDVHGLPSGAHHGRAPSASLGNAYLHHRILEPILDNVVEAERQGYAAFVMGSFSDPFIREMRSAVDIPVVSLTETALLIGCSLGRNLVAISNAPAVAWMTRTSVDAYQLQSRVLDVTAIDPPMDEPALAAGYADPGPVIAAFTRAAERAVAAGADVIIPAEGVLAQLLIINGVKSIAGAPVLDVFGAAWSYALMMARLWERTGLRVGRAWQYRREDTELIGIIHDEHKGG